MIVDGHERSGGGILQDLIDPALGLSREHAEPHVECRLHVRLHLRQHGETAGDVKSPDCHRQAGGAQGSGDIERARELVRLHADEAD